MSPPLDQRVDFIARQLNPVEQTTAMFYVSKNKYELDDSHYPFNPWAESPEGEYYNIKDSK